MGDLSRALFVGLFAALLAGCVPTELSVHDGSVVIPRAEGYFITDLATGQTKKLLATRDGDEAAFAVYSPDGSQVLALEHGAHGGSRDVFSLRTIDVATGKARSIGVWNNVTYARWAPDGRSASLTVFSSKKRGDVDVRLPELFLVDPKTGRGKSLAHNVSGLHRWMPDAKRIVVFQVDSKNDAGLCFGHLVQVDPATGSTQKLAAVAGNEKLFFDVSPDGEYIIFTAVAAGKVGEKLRFLERKPSVFRLHIPSRTVTDTFSRKVVYARYAPDGKHTLIVTSGRRTQLWIGAENLHSVIEIADDAVTKIDGQAAYASWVDKDTIIYFAATPGDRKPHLVRINIDGTDRLDLQAAIDKAASKS
ncbi:hypothetical protein HED60_05875 [Planctomycetales bacterium ZRK34]|nr:hypothetical protein HED60_05875 [Planctomycetales bacterium ZRK34]